MGLDPGRTLEVGQRQSQEKFFPGRTSAKVGRRKKEEVGEGARGEVFSRSDIGCLTSEMDQKERKNFLLEPPEINFLRFIKSG